MLVSVPMAVNSTSSTAMAPMTSFARRDSVGTGTGGRMATSGLLQLQLFRYVDRALGGDLLFIPAQRTGTDPVPAVRSGPVPAAARRRGCPEPKPERQQVAGVRPASRSASA